MMLGMVNRLFAVKVWRLIIVLALFNWCEMVFAAKPDLTMLIGNESPPKMFLKDDGRPDGYFTEIAYEVGRRAGYNIHIVGVPWARAMKMAELGDGVICGVSSLPERKKIFKFSTPVVVDRVLIVTMKNKKLTASSLADLKGLVVGVNRGSKYGSKFASELQLVHVDEDNNGLSRLRKLALGRIDAAIMPGGIAAVRLNAKTANIEFNDLTIQKTPITLDPNYFAIARSRPDANEIIDRLNNALSLMSADGSLNQILDSWGVTTDTLEKH